MSQSFVSQRRDSARTALEGTCLYHTRSISPCLLRTSVAAVRKPFASFFLCRRSMALNLSVAGTARGFAWKNVSGIYCLFSLMEVKIGFALYSFCFNNTAADVNDPRVRAIRRADTV